MGPCGHCDAEADHLISVEVPGVYDGVLFWACRCCGATDNPWPVDHVRHAVAEAHRAAWTLPPEWQVTP